MTQYSNRALTHLIATVYVIAIIACFSLQVICDNL